MLHTRSRKLLCLLLIGIMAVMGGCGAKEEEPVTSAAIVVDAAHPHRGDLVLSNQFIGSISAAESVSIMPMASGEITKVYVSIGDSVKAGQTLAKIDDEPGRLQLASAQAQYETLLASKNSSTGASWDLQMMQTDFNIEQLQDAIDAYEDQKDDGKRAARAPAAFDDELHVDEVTVEHGGHAAAQELGDGKGRGGGDEYHRDAGDDARH